MFDVITRIALEKATSQTGITYARLVMRADGVLDEPARYRVHTIVGALGFVTPTATVPISAPPAREPGNDADDLPGHVVVDAPLDDEIAAGAPVSDADDDVTD